MGTGWADPRAAHDDALFGRVGNSSSSTPRHTPPSLQTLLVGRLLGPVGVLRGASTHATRRSPPYQLDANWPPPRSRGSRSTSALCVAWFGSDGRRVYPQRLPNARGGEGSLQSCVSASGSAADARFFFFFFFFFSEPSSDLARFFDGFVSVGGGGGGDGPKSRSSSPTSRPRAGGGPTSTAIGGACSCCACSARRVAPRRATASLRASFRHRRATTTQPSTPQRLWIGTRFATSCLSGSRYPSLPTTTMTATTSSE